MESTSGSVVPLVMFFHFPKINLAAKSLEYYGKCALQTTANFTPKIVELNESNQPFAGLIGQLKVS